MTEPSLRKQLDRIVCADGVEDELVDIFTTAWEAEREQLTSLEALDGRETRAGLRAVYEALLDKLGAPDLTPSQQATVERFGLDERSEVTLNFLNNLGMEHDSSRAVIEYDQATAYARRILGAQNIDDIINEARERARAGSMSFPASIRHTAERRALS